jgi:O-antigen/teichoic acid export membrane protein
VIVYPGAAFLTALIAAGRMRLVLAVATLALAVNLAGNALAVPRFGAEGAAMMTLLTESTVTFGALIALLVRGEPLSARPLRWFVGPLVLALATIGSHALRLALRGW